MDRGRGRASGAGLRPGHAVDWYATVSRRISNVSGRTRLPGGRACSCDREHRRGHNRTVARRARILHARGGGNQYRNPTVVAECYSVPGRPDRHRDQCASDCSGASYHLRPHLGETLRPYAGNSWRWVHETPTRPCRRHHFSSVLHRPAVVVWNRHVQYVRPYVARNPVLGD